MRFGNINLLTVNCHDNLYTAFANGVFRFAHLGLRSVDNDLYQLVTGKKARNVILIARKRSAVVYLFVATCSNCSLYLVYNEFAVDELEIIVFLGDFSNILALGINYLDALLVNCIV